VTFTAFYQDIPALSIWWLSPFTFARYYTVSARKDLADLLADCAAGGYRLRESVFSNLQGAGGRRSIKDSLERSRAVVPRGMKLAQAADESMVARIHSDPTLNAFAEWMTNDLYFGVHAAKPIARFGRRAVLIQDAIEKSAR